MSSPSERVVVGLVVLVATTDLWVSPLDRYSSFLDVLLLPSLYACGLARDAGRVLSWRFAEPVAGAIHACTAVPLLVATAGRTAHTETYRTLLATATLCSLSFALLPMDAPRLWRRGAETAAFLAAAMAALPSEALRPLVAVGVAADLAFRHGFVARVSSARTFSESEGAIVSQGLALLTILAAGAAAATSQRRGSEEEWRSVNAVCVCGLAGACWTAVVTIAVAQALPGAMREQQQQPQRRQRRQQRDDWSWLAPPHVALLVGALLTLAWVWLALGRRDVLWWLVGDFLLQAGDRAAAQRLLVLLLWALALVSFVAAMATAAVDSDGGDGERGRTIRTRSQSNRVLSLRPWWQKKTVVRKWFHLLASCLFAPVALTDPALLSLAYAVATALLVLIEAVRAARLFGPVWMAVARYYGRFVDEREEGSITTSSSSSSSDSNNSNNSVLILTPIYLLVGCAVPHWCAFQGTRLSVDADWRRAALSSLAGIFVLGVGDAAAAVGGSAFGRTKWSATDGRSLEGSAAAFMAMLATSFLSAVSCLGMWPAELSDEDGSTLRFSLASLLLAVFLATLLEAHTTQIDNLVLPVYGAVLFSRVAAVVV